MSLPSHRADLSARSPTLRRIAEIGACKEGIDWIKAQPDDDTAWRTCERGDWMLWLAARTVRKQDVALAACACARIALPSVPRWDDRPLRAIETVERWARDEASLSEVSNAHAAANAAAHQPYHGGGQALYAAVYAAETVTWAVNFAPWVGYAVGADAGSAAGADAVAYRAARAVAWRECADLVRQCVPWRSVASALGADE